MRHDGSTLTKDRGCCVLVNKSAIFQLYETNIAEIKNSL